MEKSSKKKIIIVSIVAMVLIVATVTVALVMKNKKKAYRIIKVYEVAGEAKVTRDGIGEMDAYKDMVLESGDKVVLTSGEMTLRLDDDKYVYVEPDTEFKLVASGSISNSKTTIELSYGAITNEIQNPLSDKSSYEINTPNSNMAVRGTIYRVYTYYEGDKRYTKVSVFEGKVDSRLIYPDNSLAENTVLIMNGNEVLIYDDDTKTDYVGEQHDINYDELPENVIRVLMDIVEDGKDIGISYEELSNYIDKESKGPFTVTFMYNGTAFGTQTVEKGEKAAKPVLAPALSGGWDFDFSKEINSDTTIEWR